MSFPIKRILKKLYHYDNKFFHQNGEPYYSESILSDKEKAALADYGWDANAVVTFTGHSDILEKLSSLKGNAHLTRKRCLDAFVAGVGGSYPRGLSALPAWYSLENCPEHPYQEKTSYACCWVCGDRDKPEMIHDSHFQYCLYSGNAYSSSPMYAYLNLKHLAGVPAVVPTEEDIAALSALLNLLRTAPADETPGQFEKRLLTAKIMKGDKYSKRGVLHSLAIVGVIPNQFISLSDERWTNYGDCTVYEKQLRNTKGRSDMEMPWAGWMGALKLNESQVTRLFGAYSQCT